MCIGIPMQVVSTDFGSAICRDSNGGVQTIDTSLVGDVAAGDWVMTFLGAAREKMDEETARQSADAIEALERAMRGETNFDDLFADLINREPELPEHLRPAAPAKPKEGNS